MIEKKACSSYVFFNTVKQALKNRVTAEEKRMSTVTSRVTYFTWYTADSGLKRSLLFNLAQVNISEIIKAKNAVLPNSNFCCPFCKSDLNMQYVTSEGTTAHHQSLFAVTQCHAVTQHFQGAQAFRKYLFGRAGGRRGKRVRDE